MGQKINPNSFRLQLTKDWKSKWFSDKKEYPRLLSEDIRLRKVIAKLQGGRSGIAKVEIERSPNTIAINIHTSKPGMVIGRGGAGIEALKKDVEKITKMPAKINILEVKNPELVAKILGENIAVQLEKRIGYRRAIKQTIASAMRANAKGVKVQASGRLGGAEMSRRETQSEGKLPMQTIRSDIDYAQVNAYTTYGVIGIKVWVNRGELKSVDQKKEEDEKKKFNQAFGLGEK